MKTIIAGSRGLTYEDMIGALDGHAPDITEVVSGTCHGIDQFGEKWAKDRGLRIARFPADWSAHGKAAGPMRNRVMAEYADALIAVWDGKSRGTANMIEEAKKRGLKVHVFIPPRLSA